MRQLCFASLFAGTVLCVAGCATTTSFSLLRTPFQRDSGKLSFYCNAVDNEPEVIRESLQAAYAKGWRLTSIGLTYKTFLWFAYGHQQLICVEKLAD